MSQSVLICVVIYLGLKYLLIKYFILVKIDFLIYKLNAECINFLVIWFYYVIAHNKTWTEFFKK